MKIDCICTTKIAVDFPVAFALSYLYTRLVVDLYCSILILQRIVSDDFITTIITTLYTDITL